MSATTYSYDANRSAIAAPKEFICPITQKVMMDPVVSRYNVHFERQAILCWLASGNNFCPITGNPLRPSNLISDKTLQWKIGYWAKKHGIEGFPSRSKADDKNNNSNDNEDTNNNATNKTNNMTSVDSESAAEIMKKIMVGPGLVLAVPPKRFLCPLTKKIMNNPMMTIHGQNYEKSAILTFIDTKGEFCPMTGKPLRSSNIVSNSKLKWEIDQWQLHHGDASQQMSELELNDKLTKAKSLSTNMHFSDVLLALSDIDDKKITFVGSSSSFNPDVLSVLDAVVETLDA